MLLAFHASLLRLREFALSDKAKPGKLSPGKMKWKI